jgi:hypothetical protein
MNTSASIAPARVTRGLVARLGLGLLVLGTLGLAGCSSQAPAEPESPVKLTDVKAADGTPIKQVTLVDHAIERLAITTGTVDTATATVDGSSGRHKVLPYAAVVYDSEGSSWTYVDKGKGTYERARITVASVAGDVAVLTDGPPDGTVVVTQGAPELLGAEAEIAGEQ